MEKIKEYMIKNKKIIIPVVIIIILLLIGSVYLVVQANSSNPNSKQEMKETKKEDKKDLTDYVKNLKDLTVEVNAKDIDFLKDITYDKKIVKEVTVDSSKVDLSKEGKYDITYSIIPVDTTISKKTVIKTLTVEVTSKEKEAEIKKESKDNASAQKEEDTSNQNKSNTANKSNTQNTNSNSNNNSGGSSKPNTNNNSGNSSSNDTKPVEPETPKHEHNFVYVPAQTHTEYETVTHTEEIPVYEYTEWYECNKCHAQFKTDIEAGRHCGEVCGCGYSLKSDNVQTGTQTVTTEEKVPHKVIDVPAYYKCECGETHD